MQPGPLNLITDVEGLLVGNAGSARVKTGTTVLTAERPFTAAVHVMGGAPGTRDTDALAPDKLVAEVDALVLSGGSAFGLDAGGGVMAGLREMGRGFQVGPVRVPIVPGAILFDLVNGGDKSWEDGFYAGLGRQALREAATEFALGTAGAGIGATAGRLKGGLGSASLVLPSGITVGALVAANPVGQVVMGDTADFWAAPFEIGEEFGGRGMPRAAPPMTAPLPKRAPKQSTTIAIVATDARLDKAGCLRMATAAHDGMARAIVPAHTPLDGDLVFGAATGAREIGDPLVDPLQIGHAAATCLARAIARAVYLATPEAGDLVPTWRALAGEG